MKMLTVSHPDPLELAYQFWSHGWSLCLLKAASGLPEVPCFTQRAGKPWDADDPLNQAVASDGEIHLQNFFCDQAEAEAEAEALPKVIPYLTEPSKSCLPYFLSVSAGLLP